MKSLIIRINMKGLKKPGKNLMKLPETYVKKIQHKDIDHKQSVITNILTVASIEHSLIPKVNALDEFSYEMEYIDGSNASIVFQSLQNEKRREMIFKLVSQISSLIYVMSKLKNESFPNHMFIGKDMRNITNYMISKDGRIMCIDFDSWKWWPTKEAIWHARNAISFPLEKLLIS